MKLILFLTILGLSYASILEDSTNKDTLDVSYLPKEFREWHVRIVGNGYLRFLVPTSMEQFANSGVDEEKVYIDNALNHDTSVDPYSLKGQRLANVATCISSDNNPPIIDTIGTDAGLCVDRLASCTLNSNGSTVVIQDTDTVAPVNCQSVYRTCKEHSATTFQGLSSVMRSDVSGWPIDSTSAGECITKYTVTLNAAVENVVVGSIIKQVDKSDNSVLISGTVDFVYPDKDEFKLININSATGATDFVIGNTHQINIVYGETVLALNTHHVINQIIKQKTFTPSELKTFVPYINRTYTPATFGDLNFREIYSRYGLLHVNKYRLLVNVNGLLVIGKTKLGNDGFIYVPEYYNSVTIRQSGHVDIKYTDGTSEYIGRLVLATFPNRYGLNIWGKSGFEISCNGAGGFGTSLGSWCKNTGLDGRVMWYYVNTVDSGDAVIKSTAAFSPMRFQQYHLNSALKDLYLSGKEPEEFY